MVTGQWSSTYDITGWCQYYALYANLKLWECHRWIRLLMFRICTQYVENCLLNVETHA